MASLRAAFLAAVTLVVVACGPSTGSPDAGTCVDCAPDAGEQPACTPGETQACYTGPVGTEGVGPCTGGTRRCLDNGQWAGCEGQVTPAVEICGNNIDENCTGVADEDIDEDGDGYTTCEGDCCDNTNQGCASPELVNPGAFEAPGNTLDDDCDGAVDNVAAANCDTGLPSNSSDPFQYAAAMDLCQTATEAPGDLRWGVVSARIVQPDGSGAVDANQRAIRGGYGATAVQSGAAFAVLSTGHAAAVGETNPAYAAPQGGVVIGATSGFPSDWYAANGNNLPNAPGCPDPVDASSANDPAMLELRVRTPTNASSFSFSVNFFSSEYPEWTCSPYNDFFVVLLDSAWAGSPPNPADKNLAVYTAPNDMRYPVGVNLAHGNTGLFTVCENGDTGCATDSGAIPGTINTCVSVAGLAGTGMDVANPAPAFPADPGYCGSNNLAGGGTGWLQTSGNVVGGEIITLRIALWDTSDGYYDSVALVDNFQWSVDASEPGTDIPVD